MVKKSSNNQICALDIGTTKVVAIIGEMMDDGGIEVVGIGSHPSQGLKKGTVVNIEATVQSIAQAVTEAESMAGTKIHQVYTGIAGSHIRSLNSHGIVAIRDREVEVLDVERVIDAAKAVAIPADQKLIHILPQEFIIDDQAGIREPIGMSGVRLEAKVHMVTGAVSASQNIVKCVRRCGLDVADIMLQPLASSYAVLMDDERELGVCLIDIGGGTTDIAIFTQGAIRHTAVIPIAGDQVSNDIAVAMRTPLSAADRVKLNFATLNSSEVNEKNLIEIPSIGDRLGQQLSQKILHEVVRARYEELLALVRSTLMRSGFEDLIPAGIVLTGGGSKIDGIVGLAEQMFQMPVRVGYPQYVQGLEEVIRNPIYATGIGLLLYAPQQRQEGGRLPVAARGVKGMLTRMRGWFQGHL